MKLSRQQKRNLLKINCTIYQLGIKMCDCVMGQRGDVRKLPHVSYNPVLCNILCPPPSKQHTFIVSSPSCGFCESKKTNIMLGSGVGSKLPSQNSFLIKKKISGITNNDLIHYSNLL